MLEPDTSSGIKKPIDLERLLPTVKQLMGGLHSPEQTPYFIHIAGQSAVGKSTISTLLTNGLVNSRALNLDDYLRGMEAGPLNHDSGNPNKPFFAGLNPAVYDLDQLYQDLITLKSGLGIQKPLFDEVTKNRGGTIQFSPSDILIFEGIYALSSPFRDLGDLGILVEAPLHDRLMRKLVRNHNSYKQEVDGIVERYLAKDEPTYTFYRRELHEAADLVVDNPAKPSVEYQDLLQSGKEVVIQEGAIAIPKVGYGRSHTSERLSFNPNNQGEIILEYVVANRLIVQGPVTPNTYTLVQNFYDVAAK